MSKLLLVWLLLCCCNRAEAAFFPMVHYGMEEGLPSNVVYDIYRDSKGFLWFSTDKGIARYNGSRFEAFTTADGLPDNDIFFIQEDLLHRLWLGTYNGELCYYKDGVFHTAANTAFLRLPFKASHTRYVTAQPDSSLTIYFFDQRKFVDIKGSRRHIYDLGPLKAKVKGSELIHITKRSPDRFELIFHDRLAILDTAGKLRSVAFYTNGRRYRYSVCQDQQLLYSSDTIFDMQQHMVAAPGRLTPDINRIYLDKKGLFIAGYGGLLLNGQQVLPGRYVSACTQDREGNFWISTLNDGVYYLGKHFPDMTICRNAYEGHVRYAFAHNGCLFFATDRNNLYRYHEGNTVCLFDYGKYHPAAAEYATQPGFIAGDTARFYSFFSDDLFVLSQLYRHKAVVAQYGHIRDAAIKGVFSDNRYIYLHLATTIMFAAKDSLAYRSAWHRVKGQDTGERVFAMAKDGRNRIWYTTVNNVYRIINDSAVEQRGFRGLQLKWFDIYGNLMTGYTQNNRLVICDTGGYAAVYPDSGQHCVWDRLYRLDDRHVLAATNSLYRVVTLPAGIRPHAAADMVVPVENPLVPLQADYVFADGNDCYFMKNGAVTSISVANLLQQPALPVVLFTGVKTKRRHYSTDTAALVIPFAESRDINIAFTALSFSGQRLSYEYSISADADSWQPIRNEEISLFAPHYGNYTVRVRARMLSGSYSQAAALRLVIGKPYWATWWFICAAAILILLLAAVILHYVVRIVVRRRERAYEARIRFMKSEYKALNALMNPHFIFNSLNNIQCLINENDRRSAHEYLNTFSALVRQNMHNVSRELIPLKKEIELIVNYLKLEKLRFRDQLHYTIDIDEDVEADVVNIPPLLIQPLVENAIRHGLLPRRSKANAVVLRVYEDNSLLHVEVRDNGIGLQQAGTMKDPLHESLGLENIRKRIAQLRMIHGREILFRLDNITDADGAVAGTVATVTISLTDLL